METHSPHSVWKAGSLTRVTARGCQQSPLNHPLVEVQLEKPRRCFPFIRKRLDYGSVEKEMFVPTLSPGMEETHKLAGPGVDRTNIASLPCVASKAGVGKIPGIRQPTMFAAYYVVYLMRRIGVVLMKEAILAPVPGAFSDELPQGLAYVTSQARYTLAPVPWP